MQLTFNRPSLYTQRMEKTSARWWDLPSAILLFLLVLFSAWRVQVTDWTEGLNLVRNLSIFGLFVGLALGQSKFQKRAVILLSIAYMIVFFIWQWSNSPVQSSVPSHGIWGWSHVIHANFF